MILPLIAASSSQTAGVSALQAHSGAGGARGHFGRRPDPRWLRAPLAGPAPHSSNHALGFPARAASGLLFGFPGSGAVGAGQIHRKTAHLGENCSLAAARSTRSAGWTLRPCAQVRPKRGRCSRVEPGSGPGAAHVPSPAGPRFPDRPQRSRPSGSAGRAGSAGTEIAGVGSRSQRRPKRRVAAVTPRVCSARAGFLCF